MQRIRALYPASSDGRTTDNPRRRASQRLSAYSKTNSTYTHNTQLPPDYNDLCADEANSFDPSLSALSVTKSKRVPSIPLISHNNVAQDEAGTNPMAKQLREENITSSYEESDETVLTANGGNHLREAAPNGYDLAQSEQQTSRQLFKQNRSPLNTYYASTPSSHRGAHVNFPSPAVQQSATNLPNPYGGPPLTPSTEPRPSVRHVSFVLETPVPLQHTSSDPGVAPSDGNRTPYASYRDQNRNSFSPRQGSHTRRRPPQTITEAPTAAQTRSTARSALASVAAVPTLVRKLLGGRAEMWESALRPGLLYLPDSENDGCVTGALRATQLAAVSGTHDGAAVVRRGMPFTLRVVGGHLVGARRGAMRILFSEANSCDWSMQNDGYVAGEVHSARARTGAGYAPVPPARSLVLHSSGTEVRALGVRVVLGGVRGNSGSGNGVPALDAALSSGHRAVDADLTWDVGDERAAVRRGAFPLRYGYYFALGTPSAARLYATALTPEHVRLVALAATSGKSGERREMPSVSRSISYVVIRVSEV